MERHRDGQFKVVSSGFSEAGANSTLKDHHSELTDLLASQSGYIYIYASNENPVDVFFDNLQVVHDRGHILEVTHDYPGGLIMSGIIQLYQKTRRKIWPKIIPMQEQTL